MNRSEFVNSIQKGDNILIKYEKDWNSLAVVLNVYDNSIIFKDSDGKFEFTKKYLINSDLELELIQEC